MAFPLPESNPEALGLDPRPLERLCATIERHTAEKRSRPSSTSVQSAAAVTTLVLE